MNAPFEPLFNSRPHTPGACGTVAPAIAARLTKRGVAAARKALPGRCSTCGGHRLKSGTRFVCMGCHQVASNRIGLAARHELPALLYDRRKGPPPDPKPVKAKKGKLSLTKEDIIAMVAESTETDSLTTPDQVNTFLASLAG